jgi:branched-chain amino acid transport system substrate-binding protein
MRIEARTLRPGRPIDSRGGIAAGKDSSMFTKRKTRWTTAAFVCAAMFVAACGDDGDGTATASTGGGATTAGSGSSDSTGGSGAPAGGGDTSNLPDTITIGAIDSMTGPAAFCGVSEVDGMNLAIDVATEQGLVGDSQVQLELQDDASTPEGGVSAYRALVSSGVSAFVGPCFSAAAQAVIDLTSEDQIPLVLTTAGGANFADPEYAYRAGIPQTFYVQLLADALDEKGVQSVSVIFQNDNEAIVDLYNQTLKPRFEELGIEVLYEDAVAGTTQDFSAQIAQYTDNPPDAIGILMVGGANVTAVSQIREAGLDQPLFGQQAMAAPFFLENAGEAADGTIFNANFHPGEEFPSSVAFTEAFNEKFGHDPDYAAANGYDAMMRVLLAINAAGSADPADIKAALDNDVPSMDGAQGPLTFTDNGDVEGPGVIIEVQYPDTVAILTGEG